MRPLECQNLQTFASVVSPKCTMVTVGINLWFAYFNAPSACYFNASSLDSFVFRCTMLIPSTACARFFVRLDLLALSSDCSSFAALLTKVGVCSLEFSITPGLSYWVPISIYWVPISISLYELFHWLHIYRLSHNELTFCSYFTEHVYFMYLTHCRAYFSFTYLNMCDLVTLGWVTCILLHTLFLICFAL